MLDHHDGDLPMSVPPPMPVRHSTFVTVLAWILIGLSGIGTLIGILQNIMMQMLFLPAMHQQAPTFSPGMSPRMIWLFGHFQWFFRIFLLLALVHLIAAIALLLRRNWGRLLFIGVMVFDCIYQLGTIAMQWWITGSMTQIVQLPGVHRMQPDDFAQSMQTMNGIMSVMRMFSMLMAVGFIVLFVWIIRRLCSSAIRREFQTSLASPSGNSP